MSYTRSSGVAGGFGYRGAPKAAPVSPKKKPSEDFDPAEHTVPEVQEHLEENPEDTTAVMDAEGDDGRKGVLEAAYNPSDFTVGEVVAYAEENPSERDAILAAEEAGKGRTGVLDHI